MPILSYNAGWMLWNIWLAVLPVCFIRLSLLTKNKLFRFVMLVLWFVYLPNTIYIVTDLLHLLQQWHQLTGWEEIILFVQYIILEICGFATFFLAVRPFEKILREFHLQKWETASIIVLNFLVGFAMVLGRVDRVNSWEILINPYHFFSSSMHVAMSLPLVGLAILFGLFANVVYFLLKDLSLSS